MGGYNDTSCPTFGCLNVSGHVGLCTTEALERKAREDAAYEASRRKARPIGGKFGFRVGVEDATIARKNACRRNGLPPHPEYVVRLDESYPFVIAEEPRKADAILALETFVKEAQIALIELRQLPDNPTGD